MRPHVEFTPWQSITFWVTIAAAAALAFATTLPPAAAPASAPAGQFSAERAMAHVRYLAQAPRGLGNPHHAPSRAYILDQLAQMGIETRVETAIDLVKYLPIRQTATLYNIVGLMPAENQAPGDWSNAIALTTHYDSRPGSLGAADDAAGVAAVLETARALQAGPPLRHPVLLLITDGEDANLLGARAFARDSEFYAGIRLFLNLEASGSTGPSMLFETSGQNLELMRTFSQAAPHPVGVSFMGSVYHRARSIMQNTTDMTILQKGEMASLNFAFMGNRAVYHTMLDSADRLDPRSLQHHGEHLLALTRAYDQTDFSGLRSGQNATFFHLLPGVMVVYSQNLARPLALVGLALFAAVSLLLRRRGLLQRPALAASTKRVLAALALPVIASGLLWIVLVLLRPAYQAEGAGLPYQPGWFLAGFLALTLALQMLALWLRPMAAGEAERIAYLGLVLFAALTLLTALEVSSAAYLFTWPLILGSLALAAIGLPASSRLRFPLLLALLSASALLQAQTVLFFSSLIGLSFPGAPFFPAVSVSVGLLALVLLGLALPLAGTPWPRWAGWAAAALALALLAVGLALPGDFAPIENAADSAVRYRLDADRATAALVTDPETVDAWEAQFFDGEADLVAAEADAPRQLRGEAMALPAPAVALEPPTLTLLEAKTSGLRQEATWTVQSPRSAQFLRVYFPPQMVVEEIWLDGLAIKPSQLDQFLRPGDWRWLAHLSPPPQGVLLRVIYRLPPALAAEPRIFVADGTSGLPALPGLPEASRPGQEVTTWDYTIVSASYPLPVSAPQAAQPTTP